VIGSFFWFVAALYFFQAIEGISPVKCFKIRQVDAKD
jgi:hypothetical protein